MVSLRGAGLVDLLDSDPRPSFVVTLPSTSEASEAQHTTDIIYTNPVLECSSPVLDVLRAPKQDHAQFWEWITSEPAPSADKGSSLSSCFCYLDVTWTRSIVLQKWAVVGANEPPPTVEPPRKVRLDSQDGNFGVGSDIMPTAAMARSVEATPTPVPTMPLRDVSKRRMAQTEPAHVRELASEPVNSLCRSVTDPAWILPEFMPDQEPFLDVIDSVDWASTPLGPMETWSARLQQTFSAIIADSRPMALYWGESFTTIYNEAFSKLCGSKHPGLLGQPVEAAWPDSAARLKETMRTSAQKQRASVEDEWKYFLEKTDGTLEETYLKWSVIPVKEGNTCLGFMHPVLETTSMRLWERRMKMLIDLGEMLVTARDIKSYWKKTIEELEAVEPRYDVPLVVLYSVQEDSDAAFDTTGLYDSTKICHFEGGLGVPEGHPIAPLSLVLRRADEGLAPMFREALRGQYPLLIQTKDGSLPGQLLDGLQWRGFGDPCRAAVVCPIRPTKEEDVMGLMLLGLNPRRSYDNDYIQYISLLSQKLTTSLASTVLLEEEARRGRNAAAQAEFDQAMLQEKLEMRTKEATESIQKFEAVAEFIPVAVGIGDAQGNITFANDAWYRITGFPQEGPILADGFLSCVLEDDRANIVRAYDELRVTGNVVFEFRVRRQQRSGSRPNNTTNSPSFEKAGLDLVGLGEDPSERHIIATLKAERAPDGTIIRVLTCLTDVTLHKRTADEAVRRAQQAENLQRMAEFATVGMYDMDLEGRLLGANHVFYEMCGVERSDANYKPLQQCVAEEDLELLERTLRRLQVEGKSQTAELRFRTTWIAEDNAGNKIVAPRWVLATFMPVRSAEGVIKSFTGCLSDVSLQKWQLERERQRKDEAIESKRQQENFIDMTSHEMRNPLSAIIHCADSIIASLTKVQELNSSAQPLTPPASIAIPLPMTNGEGLKILQPDEKQLIENSVDNAETIIACAQHQKRIVDDILTMSKLDSNLIAVTPITVNPVLIVQEALKMFEVEARRVDINLSMGVDHSYYDLGIEFLDFDPSRLKQVLINLLTNALKFTKTGPTRNVSITLSASLTRPVDKTSSVQFIPRSKESEAEQPDPSAPGRDNPIYLYFEVKDTGHGLSDEEKKLLFQRFVQASSRTHIKYGGSGLGLFISRRLTELQNGAIGVASQPGVGSTFAFYIETFTPSEAALKEAQTAASSARLSLVGSANNAISQFNHAKLASKRSIDEGLVGTLSNGGSSGAAPQVNSVLIVEDNLINQQITRRGLLDRGFVVDIANHGVEALEKLQLSDRNPDRVSNSSDGSVPGGEVAPVTPPTSVGLILMDIEMPIQDGLTCTRNIRELERQGRLRGGRIPIIAVSANARMEQILEAKAAGCDDVVVKPYRMPELIEKMMIVHRQVSRINAEEEDEVAVAAPEQGEPVDAAG